MSQAIIGLIGIIVGAMVTFLIFKKKRSQAYYNGLIKYIGTHNWNLLSNKLNPGLQITDIDLEVSVVCYQHLNLLFYAWLNRNVIHKDGSIEGWKNWATAIVKGAKIKAHKQYQRCYHDILSHKDLYPREFITWLDKELDLSTIAFHSHEDQG